MQKLLDWLGTEYATKIFQQQSLEDNGNDETVYNLSGDKNNVQGT